MLRAATMAGGAAVMYHAGKKTQAGRDQDAMQDQQIAEMQDQQGMQQQQASAPPPPPPAPAAGGMSEDAIQKLQQLAQLHDQGILTDAEFEVQKAKILNG